MKKDKIRKTIIAIVAAIAIIVGGIFIAQYIHKKTYKPTASDIFNKAKENRITMVSDLTYSIENDEVAVTGFKKGKGKYTVLNIPDTIEGYPVTRISAKAFDGDEKLESVVIGNNVKDVGASAFAGCGNLRTVIFGAKVKNIGSSAFKDCLNLSSVTLNSNLETIGKEAFIGTGIKSIRLPNDVSIIDNPFPEKTIVYARSESRAAQWAKGNGEVSYKETE